MSRVTVAAVFILLTALNFVREVRAQEVITFPVRIDTVILVGNEKTRDFVILREIPFTFPDSLTQEDLQQINYRLQNLYLFNRVELNLMRFQNGKTALVITVTEKWYFYPLPILFLNDRDWRKISFGLQVTHFNFRGRNEKFSMGGWLGYNPSFFLNYFNPWMGTRSRLILGVSVYHKKVRNRIFDMNESHSGFDVTFGRRFTLWLQTQFKLSMDWVGLPPEYRTFNYSGRSTDLVPSLFYEVLWDRRNLFEYPTKGFYLQYIVQRTGFKETQPRFWRFQFDNRIYLPLMRRISWGVRNLTIVQSGELPIYDRRYFGFNERIRGHFYTMYPAAEDFRQYSSPNLMLWSTELRFSILPVRYYSWNNAPFMSYLYQNLKFGISGAIFLDSGIVWQHPRDFALQNYNTGFGAGIHFHLPYLTTLRIDFAFNEKWQGQLIVDIGASF